MTTLAFSTVYDSSTTAGLRTHGAELSAALTTVGLVKTADTGQVDWATVTLPAANTLIGYEIRRFPDSSNYLKMEWYTNTNAVTNSCTLYLTVGSGSDGAGAITGVKFPRTLMQTGAITYNAALAAPTYICCTDDFFGLAYKIGVHSNSTTSGPPCVWAFAIEKYGDASGDATTDGILVSYRGIQANGTYGNKYSVRTAATAADYGVSTFYTIATWNLTNTSVGADKQIFLHQYPQPRISHSNFMCTVVASEYPQNSQFTATILGSTPHNYISVGQAFSGAAVATTLQNYLTAMLWE